MHTYGRHPLEHRGGGRWGVLREQGGHCALTVCYVHDILQLSMVLNISLLKRPWSTFGQETGIVGIVWFFWRARISLRD